MHFRRNIFENVINSANDILITAHTYPDADAVCSAQLMNFILNKQFNKHADICISGDIGRLVKPFCAKIKTEEQLKPKYDLIICLDASAENRIGNMEKQFKRATTTMNIDHHDSNTLFADFNLVDAKSSSTCEILYTICLENYKKIITPQMAMYAYAGIITDTNGLMANNINASTFNVVANIINQGFDVDIIKNYFFKSDSKAKLMLLGKAFNSVKLYNNDKVALMTLSYEDLKEAQASFDDTLGIVDQSMNFYLIDIAIVIIETEKGKFYVSLRSKKTNVANIAMKLGGGGHKHVSAFQYEGKLEDFKDYLIHLCEMQYKIENEK